MPARYARSRTEAEDRRLMKMYDAGVEPHIIAEALGRLPKVVYARHSKLLHERAGQSVRVPRGPITLGAMDQLPDSATMTDQDLIREWRCTTCDAAMKDARSPFLTAKLQKRQIDFKRWIDERPLIDTPAGVAAVLNGGSLPSQLNSPD